MSSQDVAGPYIVWIDYGCEGWLPTSYPTLKEALLADKYGSKFVVTRGAIDFDAIEKILPR